MSTYRDSTSNQRSARTSIDTGSGEQRVHQGSPIRVGRGRFVNYYEDLGLSTTPEQATKIREEESAFQTSIAAEQENINKGKSALKTAQSKLSAAKSSLMSYDEAMAKSWNAFKTSNSELKKQAFPVNTRIEGGKIVSDFVYYYLPDSMTYTPSGRKVTASVAAENEGKIKNAFYNEYGAEVAENINKANTSYNQAASEVAKYKDSVDAAQLQLQGYKDQRQAMWDDAHADYQKKIDTLGQIINNFKVGEPE